jgi:hypothetical protein
MGAEGDFPPVLAITTACLLGGCFPSFQGLSSGSGGGAVSLDSGDSGSGGGGRPDAGGGDAGEGGSAHGVLNCNSLGNIGEWKDITPPGLDLSCSDSSLCTNFGARAFVLDPQNAGVLYLGVSGQGIWKSSDCGETWAMVNSGKNGILVGASDYAQLEIDPVDSRVMYTRDFDHEYKSMDGGVSWEKIWPANPELVKASLQVESLAIDPEDHEHVLLDFRDVCTAEYAPSCIAESHDGGASWVLLKTPGTAGWARPWFIDSTNWLLAQGGGLWRSSDSGANWQVLADSGLTGVKGRIYRAKGGSYYLGTDSGVIFSLDGAVWSLLANSGPWNSAGVVGDGSTVYTSTFGVCYDYGSDLKVYATAPESSGKPWTTMPSPGMTQGAFNLGYDVDHHILYSSNCRRGFWRVVTQ